MRILGLHHSAWLPFLGHYIVKLDYLFLVTLVIDILIFVYTPEFSHAIEPIILGTYAITVILPRRILGIDTLGFLYKSFEKWRGRKRKPIMQPLGDEESGIAINNQQEN